MNTLSLQKVFSLLKGKGHIKVFESQEDQVLWLETIEIQKNHRGLGTQVLMCLLEETDKKGWSVQLCADPTGQWGDPNVFNLTRWYFGLGFNLIALTEDGPMLFRSRQPEVSLEERKKIYSKRLQEFMSVHEFKDWLLEQECCWDGLEEALDSLDKTLVQKKVKKFS